MNVCRSSLPFSLIAVPLCVFRFLFDLTFIFQQRRVSESVSVCPQHRRIIFVYTEYLYGYGHTVTTEISIRMKKKTVSMRARSFHTHTHIHTYSNQRWRSLILLLYEKQIKHAYRSTMRLEWVTNNNNNNKNNSKINVDATESNHITCMYCKVFLVDFLLPPS